MKVLFKNDSAGQKNYQRLKKFAEKEGYILNPNHDWIRQVIILMTNNRKEFGRYFCPCKQHHPVDVAIDVVCPCSTLAEEIARDGYCHCRFFYRKGFEKEKLNILETITCPG